MIEDLLILVKRFLKDHTSVQGSWCPICERWSNTDDCVKDCSFRALGRYVENLDKE